MKRKSRSALKPRQSRLPIDLIGSLKRYQASPQNFDALVEFLAQVIRVAVDCTPLSLTPILAEIPDPLVRDAIVLLQDGLERVDVALVFAVKRTESERLFWTGQITPFEYRRVQLVAAFGESAVSPGHVGRFRTMAEVILRDDFRSRAA